MLVLSLTRRWKPKKPLPCKLVLTEITAEGKRVIVDNIDDPPTPAQLKLLEKFFDEAIRDRRKEVYLMFQREDENSDS